ncbi:leishmanolysin-like protein [Sarcoptes scabiei]|uniref:Leishmanolysin-like peptidase n=1 Tax=Sarcoptes scabiei TaxID=52283 RepID=A0A132AEB8_SARSC|nr:leishmanolysin-like protein [Sarcoptes scabiei]
MMLDQSSSAFELFHRYAEIPCGHIPPKPDQIRFAHIRNKNHSSRWRGKRQLSSIRNLRIKFFYDDSIETITKEKFLIIDKVVLPEAINYWQQAFRCIRDNTDYYLGINQDYCIEGCQEHTFCGEVIIPDHHLDDCIVCDEFGNNCSMKPSNDSSSENHNDLPGIKDADFVFYISTLQSIRCSKGSTIAYAAHCQQDIVLNRPIAGHANICPDLISTRPRDLETLISTFKHEILHALGFSVSLYAFYRDSEGNRIGSTNQAKNIPNTNSSNRTSFTPNAGSMLKISKKVLLRVERKNWKVRGGTLTNSVFVISTPNVVREVRNHFNCSLLEGAELENQGEDGTLLTHWEKRLFENEAMTGTHTQNPVYSRITLALMEDTGWYRVNYSLAQSFKWGKNLGCDFAMKSCKEWMDTKRAQKQSIHPYCDRVKKDPLQTECTNNRDSVALCNLRLYDEELKEKFQNFDHIDNVGNDTIGYYGGSVILADYCPYIQEFTWKQNNATVRGSKCSFVENNPLPEKNFALEQYGFNSRCINHGEEQWIERNCFEIRQWQHWGSGCYQYQCSEDGFLDLLINNHTFRCLYENQEIKIQLSFNDWLHRGSIICPKCEQICSECKNLDQESIQKLKNQIIYSRDYLKCSAMSIDYYSNHHLAKK